MKKKKLETVTLVGVDCLDLDRLVLAMDICQQEFEFEAVKILTSIESDHENIIKINPIKSYSLPPIMNVYTPSGKRYFKYIA